MQLHAASYCGAGLRKGANQDRVICDPDRGLFAAIDGVGMCTDGALAANILREAIVSFCVDGVHPGVLLEAYRAAHQEMRKKIEIERTHATLQTVGTTLWVNPNTGLGCVAHVGDTRLVSRHAKGFHRHTVDHTTTGLMPDHVAKRYKSLLTRAVGVGGFEHVGPELFQFQLKPGTLYFLMSDGVHRFVLLSLLAKAVAPDDPVDTAVQSTRRVAMNEQINRGHGDNIAIVALRLSP